MKYTLKINKQSRFWYFKGKLHREDGPAVEWPVESIKWWFLNDEQFTEVKFNAYKSIGYDS